MRIWRTILPNFTPIQFETTSLKTFFEERHPTNKKNKNTKMNSDMESDPRAKNVTLFYVAQFIKVTTGLIG